MKRIWQTLCKLAGAVIKVYEFIEINFIVWFTMIIGVMILVEIGLRAFQIQGSRWIEEVSRYMLVTTTFLGSSIAVTQKGHMTMSALVNALPHKWSNILEILTNAIGGVGFLYIGVVSFQWTGKLIQTGKLFESVSVPMWYLWAVLSVAFFTTGLRFLAQIIKNVQAIREGVYIAPQEKEM